MAFNFSELKSARNNTKFLKDELVKASGASFDNSKDDRFWYPDVDKAGNGYAVIRFLPAPAGEDVPFVRLWEHRFKGPSGSWYIEKSRTTLGAGTPDPVAEMNQELWNSGLESDKEIVRKRKRNLVFISNVLIIEDSLNPENNGKVKLYKYGKKIYDKIVEAISPPFDDEGRTPDNPKYDPTNAFDPFDLWTGANFRLKIRTDDYRNYDKSDFAKPGPLFKDDEKLESLWKSEYGLQEFIAPESFKSYDELKKRLLSVLGIGTSQAQKATPQPSAPWQDDEEESPVPSLKSVPSKAIAEDDNDEDEGLEYFKKLANRS
jgi:hypothetical protein